ncbi:MAG: hypothetical protein MUO43_12530 [Desulfobacterales bacterium]|nr:hypothetical protein [Desulfobacterales bacterium]
MLTFTIKNITQEQYNRLLEEIKPDDTGLLHDIWTVDFIEWYPIVCKAAVPHFCQLLDDLGIKSETELQEFDCKKERLK